MHDGNIKYLVAKIVGIHWLVVKASRYGLVFGIVFATDRGLTGLMIPANVLYDLSAVAAEQFIDAYSQQVDSAHNDIFKNFNF